MKKTGTMKARNVYRKLPLLVVVMLLMGLAVGATPIRVAVADQFDEQIRALRNENTQAEATIQNLQVQAVSYQDAISKLRAQIIALQAQIDANVTRQHELNQQIEANKVKLAHERAVLGAVLKAMYVSGQMSTIEMLATSKDLNEFVDAETYRSAVQNRIQKTLDEINRLQAELNGQKAQVEQLLKDQQAQQVQMAAAKTEQQNMLAYNESQQVEYNNQVKANNDKIGDLQRQQVEYNCRLYGCGGGIAGGGGYPWGFAVCLHTGQADGPCANYDWSVDGSIWNMATGGYGYRNCTDWVAWRIKTQGKYVPAGLGNANTWDDRAASYGLSSGSTPQEGAAAVSNSGYYGHVMYVEAVNGDGSIIISDYNRAGTGKYSTNTLSAAMAANLSYVYF